MKQSLKALVVFSFINHSFAENAIQDTSQWDRPRTLENFASFFKHFSSDFRTSRELPKGTTPEEQVIIDILAGGEDDGERLLELSMLDVMRFNQSLTMLEITGKVRALGANKWALI